MKQQLLVTASGEDRPGIVARLTEIFVKHGANVEESRMAILGGEFAAIILITLESDKLDGLKAELHKLENETISVHTKTTRAYDAKRFEGYARCELVLSGADHEGIVHQVSAFLKEHKVNIESMETTVVPAPETGLPLFQMQGVVLVPQQVPVSELRKQLKSVGNREGVDITLQERKAGAVGARA